MTQVFDVSLDLAPKKVGAVREALFVFRKKTYSAEFREYPAGAEATAHGRLYARATASLPFYLKWKEPFEILDRTRAPLGQGVVLHPASEDPKKLRTPKRLARLELLTGGPKDMILALAEAKGFQGLREKEILDFAGLEPGDMDTAARSLEEEGKARILAFSPLFLLSQENFDFLCGRILEFVGQFHEKHPESRGVAVEKIAKRFELPEIVGQLALKHLLKSEAVQILDEIVALAGFKVPLSPAEEGILEEMDKMCYEGRFSAISIEDVRTRFHLSSVRLQTLLGLLAEKKRIVQGKDGFYIHSDWLDEIVRRLRETGKKDLSVAEFKEMTGLSRKFAIPLLELLDEMGVTKRSGPGRIIL
jgi:selenocysteine-specific elongation factor